MPVPVFITRSNDGAIVYTNAMAAPLVGLSTEALLEVNRQEVEQAIEIVRHVMADPKRTTHRARIKLAAISQKRHLPPQLPRLPAASPPAQPGGRRAVPAAGVASVGMF